jgi:hypothetical protein
VNVLANDTNPFPDRPLTLTAARIENAAQSGASISFTRAGAVTVNPASSFIGVVSVLYTVRDATDDSTRDVTGRLQYTVRDVPGTAASPTFVEGDRQVALRWQAPATNGEPIDHYTITWSGGSPVTVPGSAATHVVTGLANGTGYTFHISAHNALGDGEVSDASATATPFGTPSAPTTATIAATGDGSGDVNLGWGGAQGNGRTVTGYHVVLSDGQTRDVGAVTTLTMPGRVGTMYTFTVAAMNDGGLRSGATPSRNSATPTPGAPAISAVQNGGSAVFTFGAARSTEAISYTISGDGVPAGTAVSVPGSRTVAGGYGGTYRLTITATSGGRTVSASASVTLVNPYAIALCYGGALSGGNRLGVAWSGSTGSHHVTFSIGVSAVDFSAASGSATSNGYAARATSNDLNTVITWIDNGTSHRTRWGDAPPC